MLGSLTHAGKVILKVAEEAATFIWETLKDFGNEFVAGFNDVLEAVIEEATEAEKLNVTSISLEEQDIDLVGNNSIDLAAAEAA